LLTFFITSISRGANPEFTSDELLYQLRETKASVMIVHPETLDAALSAAEAYGISPERIILFDGKSPSIHASNYPTVGDLVQQGLSKADPAFVERRLQPGEAKTKLAFLSFSSGTTGKPKVLSPS
jgi:4-coumarate--CoA ligase